MTIRTEWQPRRRSVVVEPDINVTPLVDVVLVLLIIFMVVAPRMEQDIPVTLPGIFNPDPDTETHAPPILVTVTNGGEYHLEGEKHDLESTVAMLSAMHSADPYRRLELRADAKLKYKDVREIYARVQQVGFPGMSLLVSHRYKGGEEPGAATAASNSGSVQPEPAPAADSAPPSADAASQTEAASAPAAAPPAESVGSRQ